MRLRLRRWRRPGAMRYRSGHAGPQEEADRETAALARRADALAHAPDEKSAEAAAFAEFKIGEDMRRRLIVRPDDE
jgi:hypothetical protein